ncbi:hypothetical protein [Synechocystis sp. LKSZ1]|uniref:hypothetical protein n=1 Tax=Synechocystis sp. LKSZ1 TaxID=3144951 RepID=UPI00336C2891
MKPMIWHPEEKDARVNQYLDRVNHEPWLAIFAGAIGVLLLLSLMIFLGLF